jgi:hypothetical protein
MLASFEHHTELYRFGDWDTAVLNENSGLPLDMVSAVRLNIAPDANWRGLAVFSGSLWTFLASDAGAAWHVDSLPNMESVGGNVRRIGLDTFAVWAGDQWRLFKRADGEWSGVSLPGGISEYSRIARYGDSIVAVSAKAGVGPEASPGDWHWLIQGTDQRWQMVSDVVRDPPRYITAIYERDGRNGLELRGWRDTSDRDEERIFLVKVDESWVPVESVLPTPAAGVSDFTIFLDGSGIGVRPWPSNIDDRKTTNWTYYLKGESGKWQPIAEVLESNGTNLIDEVLSVEDFGGGVGMRIECLAHSPHGPSYVRRWLVLDKGGKWHPLEQIAPLKELHIVEVTTDGLKSVLAVRAPSREERSGGWRLLFKNNSDSWTPWAGTTASPSIGFETIEADWQAGVIRAVLESGEELLFVRNGSTPIWTASPRSPFAEFR